MHFNIYRAVKSTPFWLKLADFGYASQNTRLVRNAGDDTMIGVNHDGLGDFSLLHFKTDNRHNLKIDSVFYPVYNVGRSFLERVYYGFRAE